MSFGKILWMVQFLLKYLVFHWVFYTYQKHDHQNSASSPIFELLFMRLSSNHWIKAAKTYPNDLIWTLKGDGTNFQCQQKNIEWNKFSISTEKYKFPVTSFLQVNTYTRQVFLHFYIFMFSDSFFNSHAALLI